MSRRRVVPSLLTAALLLAGCDGEASGPLNVRAEAFAWRGHVAAGSTVRVRDFSGSIEVKPSADDTLRVTARLEWTKGDPDKSLQFVGASTPDSGAYVCAIWGEGKCTADDYSAKLNMGSSDAKVFFTVEVPAGVRLDLANISGDVTAAASAPVKASTMNGSVRVVTSVGPVNAETLNGSVDIRMSSLVGTDSVVAKTLNGEAFIYLPSLDDARVDLGVGNGSVSSAFTDGLTTARKKITGTIGAGSRVILGHALNGEVALRKLDAEGRSY